MIAPSGEYVVRVQAGVWGDLAVGVVVALFSAALVWLVGDRVAHRWQLELRRRETDLEAGREFTRIYGEFHAMWKVWHAHLKSDNALVSGIDLVLRRGLLERAATEEGRYNALVLKLVVERKLEPDDTKVLAMFREAQQCLRESIEQQSLLSTRKPAGGQAASWQAGGAANLRFKELATRVADLVANAPRRARPGDPSDLAESTRRDFSRSWWKESVPPASWW